MALIPRVQDVHAKLAAMESNAGMDRNPINSVNVLRAKLRKISCAGMASLVMMTARAPSAVRRLIKSAGMKVIVEVSASALSVKVHAGTVRFLNQKITAVALNAQ